MATGTESLNATVLKQNIYSLRVVWRWSIAELAVGIGVSTPTMSKLCKQPEHMTIQQLNALAAFTGFDAVKLATRSLTDAED